MFENSCYYSFQRFHIKKEAKGSILFCIDWFFLFGCFFKQKNIGPQTQLIKLILSTSCPCFSHWNRGKCCHKICCTAANSTDCYKQHFFTCNHRAKNHCYGDEISVRKQAPEAVLNSTAPPKYLVKDKRNGHAHQTTMFYNEPLVPWSILV